MATKYYDFTGTVRWVKTNKPDTKYNPDGVYTVDLYPDEASKELYNESGIQVTPKEDSEGNRYIRLRRENIKVIKGERVTFGPPEVLYNGQPYTGAVGNDSLAVVSVAAYDTAKGIGHRVNRITILKLVEYVKPEPSDTPTDMTPKTVAPKPEKTKFRPF